MYNNHCHRVTTKLQLMNVIIITTIIIFKVNFGYIITCNYQWITE